MPTMQTNLPLLDLPDVVLRELLQSLPGRELKQLRLTCKTLHYYATPVLFRTIILTPHEPHFHHVLSVFSQHEGGRLAKYARTLRFDCRYPADVSTPCFWNKSHLHRFHYDAYVLRRNIGVQQVHGTYLLRELGKVLDGVHFPQLERIVVCGNDPNLNAKSATDARWNDHEPSFYAQRFRELTGRCMDPDYRWTFDRSLSRSLFYVICLLLSVWAAGQRTKSIVFEDKQFQGISNMIEQRGGIELSGGHCLAQDFIDALRSTGVLSGTKDDITTNSLEQLDQVAQLEAVLADVLV